MTPYYEHGGITIYHGDTLDVLRQMPTAAVGAGNSALGATGVRNVAAGLEPTCLYRLDLRPLEAACRRASRLKPLARHGYGTIVA